MSFFKKLFGKKDNKKTWQEIVNDFSTKLAEQTDLNVTIAWADTVDNTAIQVKKQDMPDEEANSLFLANFYHEYLQHPEYLDEMTQRWIIMTQNQLNGIDTDSVDLKQIMPVIKNAAWFESVIPDPELKGPIGIEMQDGLYLCFVIDDEYSMAYVTDDLLEKRNLSLDDLKALALDNLRKCLPDVMMEGKDGTYIISYDGYYDASFALLIDEFIAQRQIKFPIFAIPTRGAFILADGSILENGLILQEMSQQIYSESTYEISPRMYTLNDDNKEWLAIKVQSDEE